MHCHRNAHCLLIQEISDFKCECKPGFTGNGTDCRGKLFKIFFKIFFIKIEIADEELIFFYNNFLDVCDNYCENEGVCVKDSKGQPSCRCIGSFTGKHCAEKSEFAYIAGGVAGGVIFIILIILLVWMICARFVIQPK